MDENTKRDIHQNLFDYFAKNHKIILLDEDFYQLNLFIENSYLDLHIKENNQTQKLIAAQLEVIQQQHQLIINNINPVLI